MGIIAVFGLILLFLYCRRKSNTQNKHHDSRFGRLAPLSSDRRYRDFDMDPEAAPPVTRRGEQVRLDYDEGTDGIDQRNMGTDQVVHKIDHANEVAALKQEMRNLKTAVQTEMIRGPAAGSRHAYGEDAIAVLQSQTRVMREQVEYLRVQQMMDGVSDDPPAYSTLVTQ